MAKPDGALLFIKFDRYERFDWTDNKGVTKPIQSLVGLMEFGDGTRDWVKIGFPREDEFPAAFQPPRLAKGTHYAVPVIASVDKKRGEVRWTLRTDMQPFEAPDLA